MTQLHAIKPPAVYHLHRTPPPPPPPLPSPQPSNTTTAAAPVIIIFDGQLISWPGALTSVGSTHQDVIGKTDVEILKDLFVFRNKLYLIMLQLKIREKMAKLREEIVVQKAKETELNKVIHITDWMENTLSWGLRRSQQKQKLWDWVWWVTRDMVDIDVRLSHTNHCRHGCSSIEESVFVAILTSAPLKITSGGNKSNHYGRKRTFGDGPVSSNGAMDSTAICLGAMKLVDPVNRTVDQDLPLSIIPKARKASVDYFVEAVNKLQVGDLYLEGGSSKQLYVHSD
ncbi:hypothetical protein QVD17_38147 [Tagetes erecta]|uniref:Uncharacterized protein n=1 Tax=Tagetes erecta TaxID=13708 RepID=A0AAD8JXE2_TARER|nr:hypothetical protein QVD17_38147 [Tagetes erecta]